MINFHTKIVKNKLSIDFRMTFYVFVIYYKVYKYTLPIVTKVFDYDGIIVVVVV